MADRASIPAPGTLVDYDAPLATDKEYFPVGWILVRRSIGYHALSSGECHIQQAGQAKLECFFCVIVSEDEGKYSCVCLNASGMQVIGDC